MDTLKKRIAIVTGPTGGHFFPGLAIGLELAGRGDAEVRFFVPERKYLVSWLERKSFEYRLIPEVKLSLRNILTPVRFVYAFFRACLFLSGGKFNGTVITGSYATVPFLLASRLCGIKILVHEQNVLPGRVTKISARIADRIAVSFPVHSSVLPGRKTAFTGFPLIPDFKERLPAGPLKQEMGLAPDRFTVLVLGGSQGAGFLNKLISENLCYFSGKKVQFIHLAGKESKYLAERYGRYDLKAKVFDFYFDMAKLYSIADAVICRAGAGTLAEINERQLPAIVIPYPYAGEHQKYNAAYFAERGGCITHEQKNGKALLKEFPGIFEDFLQRRDEIKENLKKISIVDSEGKTSAAVMELTGNG